MLAEHGVSSDSLAKLKEVRRLYAPVTQQMPTAHVDTDAALEALERTRAISLRLEDERAWRRLVMSFTEVTRAPKV